MGDDGGCTGKENIDAYRCMLNRIKHNLTENGLSGKGEHDKAAWRRLSETSTPT